MGNGDIRSIYVVVSVSVHYILGYDVPACGSRVPFVYVVHISLTVPMYDVVGYFLIGVRLVWIILLLIRTIGGWDWPGVGIGVLIRIDC